MAQARVTEYFVQRKRAAEGAAESKRRKMPEATSRQKLEELLRPPGSPERPARTEPPSSLLPSSKKRSRQLSGGGGRPELKRSARKKLRLLEPECLIPRSQVRCVTSLGKKRKDLVNTSLSPKSPAEVKVSCKEYLELNSRLQKIQELSQRLKVPAAPIQSKVTITDLKTKLKEAQEAESKIRAKKSAVNQEAEQTEEPSKEGEKPPAYERFHTLAQDGPPGLSLPFRYKVLAEMFRSMDTIVGMLFNRSETVTFSKVKQGVQDMMRKQFEERNVGQIKTVYPTAYRFRQEKNIPTFKDGVKKTDYHLTVEPIVPEEDKVEGRLQLSACHILERRKLFHRRLTNIVKRHHKSFLAALNPPLVVPDDQITRWHPRFNVDDVPDVLPAALPQAPQVERLTTAQEVLSKARGMMTPKMEKALANLALRTAETHAVDKLEPSDEPTAGPAVSCALKGVSQSLLERIRAKEAQKLQAIMTRKPQQEERLLMMSRLPELTRILRNVFIAEKKPALTLQVVCDKVMSSYRSSMSSGDVEKHLTLLVELLPDWLTVHLVRKDIYYKINKTTDVNLILERLAKKMKTEESH